MQQAAEATAAPGVRCKVHAKITGIIDTLNGVRGSAAAGAEEADSDDGHLPADACHAGEIVPHTTNRACTVCAVAFFIHGVVVIGEEVPAVDVIDKSVAIVIDAISRDFVWVRPHIRR